MPFRSAFSHPKYLSHCLAAGALALMLAGCSPVAAESPASTAASADTGGAQPRVFFVAPQDGVSVRSPVRVQMQAKHFVVEPAGEVRVGAGRTHPLPAGS